MTFARDLHLHIELEEIDPPIWRRLRVRDDLNLASFHLAVQAAMGWEDSHLYEFRLDGRVYASPQIVDDGFADERLHDARAARLRDFRLGPGEEFLYVYDLGDDWAHRVRVEAIEKAEADDARVECLGGARRCPPEDCGGASGYASMLAALRDPDDPEHDDWRTWVGADYDAEHFSVETANATLAALFEPGGRAEISELPPGVTEGVDEAVAMMEGAAEREPRISEAILAEASELLRRHSVADPEELLRTRRLEGWAGGALHAVFQLDRSGEIERMTLKELGELLGVSSAAVAQRSSRLRSAAGPRAESRYDAMGFLSRLSTAFQEVWTERDWAGEEAGGSLEEAPAYVVAEELLRAAEEAPAPVAEALELRAADLLAASAAALDDVTLARLIRTGMESGSEEAFARFLALAIREFGVGVATSWLPPGYARGRREWSEDDHGDGPGAPV